MLKPRARPGRAHPLESSLPSYVDCSPMPACLFASDLHGRLDRYEKLSKALLREKPAALFLGGDLLPHGRAGTTEDFLIPGFAKLKSDLGKDYPRVFLILGNDDPRREEPGVLEGERRGLWEYAHNKRLVFGSYAVYGYACIPPTPFLLKDWERYDVSRYVDPGCVSPEDGARSVPVAENEARFATIARDLEGLAGSADLSGAVFLFHAPPYRTALDRAALDGRNVDHAPLDVHVGSIAIRRFIEDRKPRVTLHGHIHESVRLTGAFLERIGATVCLGAAHDGPELALVSFDPRRPEGATRELL